MNQEYWWHVFWFGSGEGFRCIEQASRDVSLSFESLSSENDTSEPEFISWESSACISPSAKGSSHDVAGRSRFRILQNWVLSFRAETLFDLRNPAAVRKSGFRARHDWALLLTPALPKYVSSHRVDFSAPVIHILEIALFRHRNPHTYHDASDFSRKIT